MRRTVILFCILPLAALGESWPGVLVDARCWIREEHNVGPKDTNTYVDRDRNLEIRFCAPTAKTKSFVLVPVDGVGLRLDATGNGKAADLVQAAGKQPIYRVSVTGKLVKETLNVVSISIAK